MFTLFLILVWVWENNNGSGSVGNSRINTSPLPLQHFIQFSFAEPHLGDDEGAHIRREGTGESPRDARRETEFELRGVERLAAHLERGAQARGPAVRDEFHIERIIAAVELVADHGQP